MGTATTVPLTLLLLLLGQVEPGPGLGLWLVKGLVEGSAAGLERRWLASWGRWRAELGLDKGGDQRPEEAKRDIRYKIPKEG